MARNVHNLRWYVIGCCVREDNYAEELQSVKAIDSYIAPFNPDIIIADGGYGKDRNAYLLRKYGAGRFYSCWYNPSTKGSRTFTPVWSAPELARVLVDRTMSLKVLCRAVKEREFGLPTLDDPMMQLLKKHFMALAPLRVEEEGEIVEEISAVGDDHLAHSTFYSYLGIDSITRAGKFNFEFM
jgi:hypothetical protein